MIDVDIFGLYELDDQGVVRYSRRRNGHGLDLFSSDDIVGMDFFRDVAKFDNRDLLRDHFRRFLRGTKSAENFTFDCIEGQQIVRSYVHMIRAQENAADRRSEIVIVDIKKAEA